MGVVMVSAHRFGARDEDAEEVDGDEDGEDGCTADDAGC